MVKSAISTSPDSIKDQRQGATSSDATVYVSNFDVGKIKTAIASGTVNKVDFSNPVIYITNLSASPSNGKQRAIRLKNGASLPTQGLTIASGNPVYIQGDYNTGMSGTTQPPSNTSTTPFASPAPDPTVSGYNRAPAAVVADAVTILSNAWAANEATFDGADLSARVATNTTVNAAIIAGIVPSKNGYYSGGVENYPRFLENWSSKTLTYYGSMIELYASQQGLGRWGADNVYSPPNRAWFFDKKFLSNPPAGVPYDVDYRRSRWFME